MKYDNRAESATSATGCTFLASSLHAQRFTVVPVRPGTAEATVPLESWLDGYAATQIRKHWRHYPGDEVGIYVGWDLYVLESEGERCGEVLETAESLFGTLPSIVVNTGNGCQHFFSLPENVWAREETRVNIDDTRERIHVKTGPCLIRAPGNPGMHISEWNITSLRQLAPVSKDFADVLSMSDERFWSFAQAIMATCRKLPTMAN